MSLCPDSHTSHRADFLLQLQSLLHLAAWVVSRQKTRWCHFSTQYFPMASTTGRKSQSRHDGLSVLQGSGPAYFPWLTFGHCLLIPYQSHWSFHIREGVRLVSPCFSLPAPSALQSLRLDIFVALSCTIFKFWLLWSPYLKYSFLSFHKPVTCSPLTCHIIFYSTYNYQPL